MEEINAPTQYSLIIKAMKKLPKNREFNLLDIGAGTKDIQKFLPKNINYISLDCRGDHDIEIDLDKGSDGNGHIPIDSKAFDIILCTETLEHLQNPHKVMNEILRISKDDASIFLSMPNEYNFWLRLQYLLGIKDKMKEPFQVVNRHLHIHLPRVKDIEKFFGNYLYIEETYYGWSSYRFPKVFDKALSKLSKIYPSLFARIVTVKARKYTAE